MMESTYKFTVKRVTRVVAKYTSSISEKNPAFFTINASTEEQALDAVKRLSAPLEENESYVFTLISVEP